MSEKKLLPLKFKYTNKIYGVKQCLPDIDRNDDIIDKLYQSAKVNGQFAKKQIIKDVRQNPLLPPNDQKSIQQRQKVESIINDINQKGFISWMITKKQMRKLNQQNRLGNNQYSMNLIQQIEASEEGQALKKQSQLFSEQLMQTISPTSTTSKSNFDQKSIVSLSPSNLQIVNTSPDESRGREVQLFQSPKKLSILKDQLVRQFNSNEKNRRSITFKLENESEVYQYKQNENNIRQIKSQSQMKPYMKRRNHLRIETLPTNIRADSLPSNLNSIQTEQNSLNLHINDKQSKILDKIKVHPLSLDKINLNKILDTKQITSNESTRNNSVHSQQITQVNQTEKTNNTGFFTDRKNKNNESKNFTPKRRNKTLDDDEKILEEFSKQNMLNKQLQTKDFNIFEKVKKLKTWRKKISEDFDQELKVKQQEKDKLSKRLQIVQDLYDYEDQPVVCSQLQTYNKNFINSPLFEFQQAEPFRKTFLLFDYVQENRRFQPINQETELNFIPTLKKCEALKKFNHYLQKYRIVKEV